MSHITTNPNPNNNNNNEERGVYYWAKQIAIVLVLNYFISAGINSVTQPADTTPMVVCLYQNGLMMDLWVFISESNDTVNFDNPNSLIWKERNIALGSWEGNTRKKTIEFPLTPSIQNNGSVFAHAFFLPKGKSPISSDKDYANPYFSTVHQLNRYALRDTTVKKNLLSGEMDPIPVPKGNQDASLESSSKKKYEVFSLWKGNYTISLIQDIPQFRNNTLPQMLTKHFNFTENGTLYYPVVYNNDFWIISEDLMIINDTVDSVPLHLLIEPLSFNHWNFYINMEESLNRQLSLTGNSEAGSDMFKRLLLDNNPYFLGFTMIISLVHSILDCMAFKNDIQFWRSKKSMEGLSIRTLYTQVICTVIILLYLLDHHGTSWLILGNVIVSLVIDIWKITRAVVISVGYWSVGGTNIPILKFMEKASYVSKTREHDITAMKYLHYALYPCVVGYAIYSLYYESHKSWYSWVVSTAAGCVYTFGFIMMTPQLFINYKLKSVAHLPWRVFVYKAISTFIDDLFAFMIRMPTLHRLRVFRDDLIFLIYLYQRWIYPVDSNRIETTEFEDVTVEELRKAKEEVLARQAKEEQERKAKEEQTRKAKGEQKQTRKAKEITTKEEDIEKKNK
jgi:hypothetical protein